MKVLLVSNQKRKENGNGNPIMYRLQDALNNNPDIDLADFIPFGNKLMDYIRIRRNVKLCDVLHVHFGGIYTLVLCFFLIGVRCKKVITFHGTDIHAKGIKSAKSYITKIKIKFNQWSSFCCIALYDKVGFVSDSMIPYVPNRLKNKFSKKLFVQKLGVDYNVFKIENKLDSQKKLGLEYGKYVLFSDVSNTPIKRRDIAKAIAERLPGYKLLIMCQVLPDLVPTYINACEFLLLTSDEEGSPNIIRECLSLNKPVFSVNVGDAAEQISGLQNSAIISRNPIEASILILEKIGKKNNEDSRLIKQPLIDLNYLIKDIVEIYKKIEK